MGIPALKGIRMKHHQTLLIFIGSCLGGVIGGAITNLLLEQTHLHAQTSINEAPLNWEEKVKLKREKEAAHTQSLELFNSEGFVLRDKQGKTRAILSTRLDGSPELKFYDDQGAEVVSLDPEALRLKPNGKLEPGAILSTYSLDLYNKDRSISLDVGQSDVVIKERPPVAIKISDDERSRRITLSTELHEEIRRFDHRLHGTLEGRVLAGAGIEVEMKGEENRHVLLGLDPENYPFLEMNGAISHNPSFILRQFPAKETVPSVFLMGFRDPQGELVWNPQTWGSAEKPWLLPRTVTELEWQMLEWQAIEGDVEFGENNLMVNFYLGPESNEKGTIYCDLEYLATASAYVV